VSVGLLGLVLACHSSAGSGDSVGTDASATDTKTTIGVSQCDEYLSKVRRCISEHAPAEKRRALEDNLTQTQASWTSLASNAGTRPSLGQTCGFALKSMKVNLQSLACDW
jgi:hypothetical protein